MTVPTGVTLTTRGYTSDNSQTLSGAGTVSVAAGAGDIGWFSVTTGSPTISVARLDVNANSFLAIDTGGTVTFDTTRVENFGATRWVRGDTEFDNGAEYINRGPFEILTTANHSWGNAGAGRGAFWNNSSVTQAGTADNTINSEYHTPVATATTRVKQGSLTFTGNGAELGSFEVDAGATMTFSAGTYGLHTGAAFSGAGTVSLTGTGSFLVHAGQSVSSSAQLMFGADINLQGPGTFASTGNLTWNSGTVKDLAQFSVSAAFSLATGGGKTLENTRLSNSSHAVWNDGTITLTDAGFENLNLGTFDVRSNQMMLGTGTFRNLAGGTVKKSAGVGLTTIDVIFEHMGLLQLLGRDVRFKKGLTQSGTGSLTDLGGGNLELEALKTFNLTAGTLKGGGEIDGGELINSGGVVEVGDNPANRTLKITGKYTRGATATLKVTVAADGMGGWDFGLLDVTGTATLAGALDFTLPNGAPPVNTTGTILKSGGLAGVLTPPPGWTVAPAGNNLTATKQ